MRKITFDIDELNEVAIKAIKDKMAASLNYGEMNAIMNSAFEENKVHISEFVHEALGNIFTDKKYRRIIIEEFEHKVAKNLVGKLEGHVEKAVEVLRNDPTLRARMIIAIENIVKESEHPNDK
jgi:dihydroneopterin aldolase